MSCYILVSHIYGSDLSSEDVSFYENKQWLITDTSQTRMVLRLRLQRVP